MQPVHKYTLSVLQDTKNIFEKFDKKVLTNKQLFAIIVSEGKGKTPYQIHKREVKKMKTIEITNREYALILRALVVAGNHTSDEEQSSMDNLYDALCGTYGEE